MYMDTSNFLKLLFFFIMDTLYCIKGDVWGFLINEFILQHYINFPIYSLPVFYSIKSKELNDKKAFKKHHNHFLIFSRKAKEKKTIKTLHKLAVEK